MTFILQDLLDHIVSHAQSTGYFDRVNQHEPKNPPGNGITCSVWLDQIRPVKSGLDSISLGVVFTVRLYSNLLADPLDDQDPNLSNAAAGLWSNLASDFTFDDTTRCVDIFGMEGDALQLDSGYVTQDQKTYRVYTIKVPVIVNDVYELTP